MRAPSPFDPVASVLTDLAQRFGMQAGLLEQQLRRRWPAIVGEHMAAHTRPDQIRYRKLYLLVESSVWLHQLSFLKAALVEKINADAGSEVVTEIVLRVGEMPRESPTSGDAEAPPGPEELTASPEAMAQAAALVAEVTDPELRSRLIAARAAALGPPARPNRTPRPTAP